MSLLLNRTTKWVNENINGSWIYTKECYSSVDWVPTEISTRNDTKKNCEKIKVNIIRHDFVVGNYTYYT